MMMTLVVFSVALFLLKILYLCLTKKIKTKKKRNKNLFIILLVILDDDDNDDDLTT